MLPSDLVRGKAVDTLDLFPHCVDWLTLDRLNDFGSDTNATWRQTKPQKEKSS